MAGTGFGKKDAISGTATNRKLEEREFRFKTPQEIRFIKAIMVKYICFWRAYPDLFLDQMKVNNEFNFFFYQRIFLRVICRYRYSFFTFTRAFSKSFLTILGQMTRCVLYPNTTTFICAPGKE